jgi:ribosomal protein L40E
MPLKKSKEQREAKRAELERQDREHAARLAAVSARATRPPLFCQACEAKLKPTATTCHYCGSNELGPSQPSCPRFSEATVDGRCPKCHGNLFTAPDLAAPLTVGGFMVGGAAAAAVGAVAAAAMSPSDLILCVTCGARFRRG